MRENYGEKYLLITEEVEICKRLSSNDEKVRKKGVLALKHLLKNIDKKSVVDINDYKRLWSGIFNFIWMSDKPLIQEENIESICELIHIFQTHESAMAFVREFFSAMSVQWNRISHYRTDKFLMFIRRFVRQVLTLLKNSSWNIEKIEAFSNELYVALQVLPFELILHLNDIFIEELAKVSEGQLSTSALISLLKGYLECIANMKPSMSVISNINNNIFCALSRQLKICLKQKAVLGYDLDSQDVQEYENDPENPMGKSFDPRPGNVNVYLPYIEFAEDVLADFIEKYREKPFLHRKVQNILSQIVNTFRSISKLRRTLKDPVVVEREATEKRIKPKKRRNKLAPLIKQSCKRLEREEVEYDRRTEEKILKKLVKMSDILQVQVGKKKVMVPKKLEKSDEKRIRKRKRYSGNDSWTVTAVTKNIDDAGSCTSNVNEDWTITETDNQDSHTSNKCENYGTDNVELTQNVEVSKSPSPIIKNISVECKRPRLRSVSKESPNTLNSKSSIGSITLSTEKLAEIEHPASPSKSDIVNSSVKVTIENKLPKEISDIDDETFKVELSSPKRPTKDDNEENTMPEEDKLVTSVRKTSTTKTKELTGKRGRPRRASILEDVLESSVLSNIETRKSKRRRTEADALLESKRDTTPPPATVTTSPQTPSMRTRSRMRSRAETNAESPIVNERITSENDSMTVVNSKEMKKSKRRVSFDAKPSTITYPAEEKDADEPREVIVPLSAVKDRPKLLKDDVLYTIVDLSTICEGQKSENSSNASASESSSQLGKSDEEKERVILDANNPAWKSVPKDEIKALVSEVEEDKDVHVDYDISYLFASPEQKPKGRRSVRKSVQIGELKRSERLANKTKKVEFSRKNTFQAVEQYYESIRARPEIPHDDAKVPRKSILKPYCVPSPINPFYLPDERRKLTKRISRN